ncbi:MAG: hypothetical protein BJ554DRAFT_2623, partial [Olpidium bornovanus]
MEGDGDSERGSPKGGNGGPTTPPGSPIPARAGAQPAPRKTVRIESPNVSKGRDDLSFVVMQDFKSDARLGDYAVGDDEEDVVGVARVDEKANADPYQSIIAFLEQIQQVVDRLKDEHNLTSELRKQLYPGTRFTDVEIDTRKATQLDSKLLQMQGQSNAAKEPGRYPDLRARSTRGSNDCQPALTPPAIPCSYFSANRLAALQQAGVHRPRSPGVRKNAWRGAAAAGARQVASSPGPRPEPAGAEAGGAPGVRAELDDRSVVRLLDARFLRGAGNGRARHHH